MPSSFDLHHERLATTNASGGRIKLYPADVKGPYRTVRTLVSYGLIVLFLALPWLKVNGAPVLLLDIAHRHFSILGLQFRGDDAPILFFVLGLFILTIALTTSRWGRIWCGWACPQTVFIDGFYRRIDRWIEGSAHSQKLLDQSPWTPKKWGKKGLKTVLYCLASMVITHSFLAVLVGGPQLWQMMQISPFHNPGPALLMLVSTAFILVEFGIFREQFCIIACPYGRLQSVLQDDHSTVVLYDEKRGESRKKDRNDTTHTGDCINCYRCVQVCPTGVDIRRGLQMECIQCTACIDACDTVMTKIGKRKGLIRYDSVSGMSGKKGIRHIRSILYTIVLLLFAAGLILTLRYRQPLRIEVLRGSTPFQVGNDHIVTNHFRIHVYNRIDHDVPVTVNLLPHVDQLTWVIPELPTVRSGEQSIIDIFVRFPQKPMPKIVVEVSAQSEGTIIRSKSDPFELVEPDTPSHD
jgi:cytochrome c oxidase accessory protein FixG